MKIDLSLLALLTTCTQLLTGVEKEERTHQSSPNGAKEGSGNGKKVLYKLFPKVFSPVSYDCLICCDHNNVHSISNYSRVRNRRRAGNKPRAWKI